MTVSAMTLEKYYEQVRCACGVDSQPIGELFDQLLGDVGWFDFFHKARARLSTGDQLQISLMIHDSVFGAVE